MESNKTTNFSPMTSQIRCSRVYFDRRLKIRTITLNTGVKLVVGKSRNEFRAVLVYECHQSAGWITLFYFNFSKRIKYTPVDKMYV